LEAVREGEVGHPGGTDSSRTSSMRVKLSGTFVCARHKAKSTARQLLGDSLDGTEQGTGIACRQHRRKIIYVECE